MGRWRRCLSRPLRGGASGARPGSRRCAALLFGPRPLLGGKAARVWRRGRERERPRGGARGATAGPFVSPPAPEACGPFRPLRPRGTGGAARPGPAEGERRRGQEGASPRRRPKLPPALSWPGRPTGASFVGTTSCEEALFGSVAARRVTSRARFVAVISRHV